MEVLHNLSLFDFYSGHRFTVNGVPISVGMCVGTGSFFVDVAGEQKYTRCIVDAKKWVMSKINNINK